MKFYCKLLEQNSSKMSVDEINMPSTSSSSNSNSNGVLSLQFLCSFIKPYDGDRKKIHSFIRNCDNAMKLAKDFQKDPMFNFICSQLCDKAELAIANHDYKTWDQLREFLLLSYAEKKSYGHLQIELQTCKQYANEDITNFMQRIETCQVQLLQLARTLSETEGELQGRFAVIKDTALQTFIINCLPQYSQILRSRDPQTLSEAYDIAIREEKIQNFQNRNKFHKFNENTKFKKNSQFVSNNNGEKGNNGNNNKNETFNKNSAKPKAIFLQNKICKYCKKPGHIVDNCYKLKNKKAKENKEQNKNHNENAQTTKEGKVMNLNAEMIETTAELRSLNLNKADPNN